MTSFSNPAPAPCRSWPRSTQRPQPGELPGRLGVEGVPGIRLIGGQDEAVAVGHDAPGLVQGRTDDELGQVPTASRDGPVDESALASGGAHLEPTAPPSVIRGRHRVHPSRVRTLHGSMSTPHAVRTIGTSPATTLASSCSADTRSTVGSTRPGAVRVSVRCVLASRKVARAEVCAHRATSTPDVGDGSQLLARALIGARNGPDEREDLARIWEI